ncbi:F-box/kelch-repeat protein At3g06240-like [Papaver somniferum]|uniref:F-box/kelch-repeat protein At3g06240-like n=1 Tax=Papaver somniferum TaxID=3469 RepID=UPI000E701D64|nr:F-box/kelch-repeat protein At3g06240-like [Papaver somniferum]
MSTIPEEIYLEILYRVPVETIGVRKCVCKYWLSLISSPDFVKIHLNHTIKKNNPTLLLQYHDYDKKCGATYSISYDLLSSSMNDFEDNAVNIRCPLVSCVSLGTCDGLVCCLVYECSYRGVLFRWNPTTQEYKLLPVSPNESSVGKEIGICGFGYDHKINDYKVVKLLQYIRDVEHIYPIDRADPSKGMSAVDVYTMGSNSWKSIESVPYSFTISGVSGVLVNGALHWLGHTQALHRSLVVVSLNVSEERFEEMELPKQPYEKNNKFMTVGALEGFLRVIVNVDNTRVEVWKMREYGVQESWNICHVVTNKIIVNDSYLKLVWFRNGEILFKIPCDLVFYEQKHGTAVEPNIRGSLLLITEDIYFESLVSVDSGTYVEPYRGSLCREAGLCC